MSDKKPKFGKAEHAAEEQKRKDKKRKKNKNKKKKDQLRDEIKKGQRDKNVTLASLAKRVDALEEIRADDDD